MQITDYPKHALAHLENLFRTNEATLCALADEIVEDVLAGKSLFAFGSGHSALLPLELYHRAGGASFFIPIVADHILPSAGPRMVKLFERTSQSANFLLDRFGVEQGEMIWLISQSGINAAIIDLANECQTRGLKTVAITSLAHSQSLRSRHPSGKRLFEVCRTVIDLGGVAGDAALSLKTGVSVGPLSTLGGIFLSHSLLSYATSQLEEKGKRCVYTSVNTPEGEKRNQELEDLARRRDFLLR